LTFSDKKNREKGKMGKNSYEKWLVHSNRANAGSVRNAVIDAITPYNQSFLSLTMTI